MTAASSLLHPCDHCGKSSPSNLRCSQCQSVWYCDRSCQSSAWNPPSTTTNTNGHVDGVTAGGSEKHGGHREVCRRLRKTKKKQNAFIELMQHVQTLDCNEAYRRRCLVQDEIQRLKSSEPVGEMPQRQNNNNNNVQQAQLQRHESNHMYQALQNEDTRIFTITNGETKSTHAQIESKSAEVPIITPNPNDRTHVSDTKSLSLAIQTSELRKVSGIWLHQGGKISIEYLPNVKCYRVILLRSAPTTSTAGEVVNQKLNCIPKSLKELHCTITPKIMKYDGIHDHFEIKLYQSQQPDTTASLSAPLSLEWKEVQILLLSMSLPTPTRHTSCDSEREEGAILPEVSLSLDDNSISLRIQLTQNEVQSSIAMNYNESENMVDNLLGVDPSSSSFSPRVITNAVDLNYLRCRSCQHRILLVRDKSATITTNTADNTNVTDNDNPHSTDTVTTTPIIQSVLPLPSGYWDDISDYLMCYDGQATVDFTSSSTCATATMALEDDAILVLHRTDLDVIGGVCVLDGLGGGYGERTTMDGYGKHDIANGASSGDVGGGGGTSFRKWKDRAAIHGIKSIVTCASCYSTLGYVSGYENDTFRLYKHLLDCGKELDDDGSHIRSVCGDEALVGRGGAFSQYTCASFLARELVRYAESDAIYTFIVAISDVNDWTRMGRNNPGEYIFIRTLGWDTPMSTVTGCTRLNDHAEGDLKNFQLNFRKVVKVIFEVVTDRNVLTSSQMDNGDSLMEWTWGGLDFCCPPPRLTSSSNADSLMYDEVAKQKRASSVGIFLSEREWSELKYALHRSSDYFTQTVSDAIVMTKLGVLPAPTSDRKQTARLSFLPLVMY